MLLKQQTGVLKHYTNFKQSGELTKADAQRHANGNQLKDIRYANQEYFWINDYNAHHG